MKRATLAFVFLAAVIGAYGFVIVPSAEAQRGGSPKKLTTKSKKPVAGKPADKRERSEHAERGRDRSRHQAQSDRCAESPYDRLVFPQRLKPAKGEAGHGEASELARVERQEHDHGDRQEHEEIDKNCVGPDQRPSPFSARKHQPSPFASCAMPR